MDRGTAAAVPVTEQPVTGSEARIEWMLRRHRYFQLVLPGRPAPRDEGAVVEWWWLGEGPRLAVALGGAMVVLTAPAAVTRPVLTFERCDQVLLVDLPGTRGGVEVARDVTVRLEPMRRRPRDERRRVPAVADESPALIAWCGRRALAVVESGGASWVREGHVADAAVLRYHLIVRLDDASLLSVRRPEQMQTRPGGTLRLLGHDQRVVVDARDSSNRPQVLAERPAAIILRPGDAHG